MRPMRGQQEKRKEFRLKFGPKKLKNYNKHALNNSLRRSEGYKNKLELRRPNSRVQYESRKS